MNERVYLQNFVDLLAEKHGMEKKDAEKFAKEFFLLIEEALEQDRSVKIKGLGTFKLVEVDSRESVKVNTGERFQIQGYTKISFVPDTSLRDLINKPFAHFETVVLNEKTVLEDTPVVEAEEEEGTEAEEEEVVLPSEDVLMQPTQQDVQMSEEDTADNRPSEPVATEENEEEKKQVEEESETKPGKDGDKIGEKPTVTYLVIAILIVLLLCGGALLWVYYPDWLEKNEDIENPVEKVDVVDSAPVVPTLSDTVTTTQDTATTAAKQDTVVTSEAVVPPVKKEPEKVSDSSSKSVSKSTAKPVPFKADSVNYTITGTKTTYTIKEGETLTRVSLRFYGTKALWPYIVRHNSDVIKNPDHVPSGTTIKIPELTKR